MSGFAKLTVLSAALAAGLLVAGAASAQMAAPGDDEVSVRVRANDLNLNTEAGARTMMDRIRSAAAASCGSPSSNMDGDYKSCVDEAVSGAVKQTKSPMVMAMSKGQSGGAYAQASQPTYRGYTAGETTHAHHRTAHHRHHHAVHHTTRKSTTAETQPH